MVTKKFEIPADQIIEVQQPDFFNTLMKPPTLQGFTVPVSAKESVMVKKEAAPVQETGEAKPDLFAALQNRTVKDFARGIPEAKEDVFADEPKKPEATKQEVAEEKPARRGLFSRAKERFSHWREYRRDLNNEVNAAKANGLDEQATRDAVFKEHYPEKVVRREEQEREREERRAHRAAERTADREMHAQVTAAGGGPVSHLTADLHRDDPKWLEEQRERLSARRDRWKAERTEYNQHHAAIDALGGGFGSHMGAELHRGNKEWLEHQRERLATHQNEHNIREQGKREHAFNEAHMGKEQADWLASREHARLNAIADEANGLTPRPDLKKDVPAAPVLTPEVQQQLEQERQQAPAPAPKETPVNLSTQPKTLKI